MWGIKALSLLACEANQKFSSVAESDATCSRQVAHAATKKMRFPCKETARKKTGSLMFPPDNCNTKVKAQVKAQLKASRK